MKTIFGAKAIVGAISAMAITGSMAIGMALETSSVPDHWFVGDGRAAHVAEVKVVNDFGGRDSCDWVSTDSTTQIAKCPRIVVTAKRAAPDSARVVASAR